MSAGSATGRLLATGLNAFQTDRTACGVVEYLARPRDVLRFVDSGAVHTRIALVRGGATTFLSPALTVGVLGIITMTGGPESHLGILAREFQAPCAMSVSLADGGSRYVAGATGERHFDEIVSRLDGRRVVLDVSSADLARVCEVVS